MNDIVKVHDLHFKPIISKEKIQERVLELGKTIAIDYSDKMPLFLGILNGAFLFAADLIRAANIPCEISFVKLASYDGISSSGQVLTKIGLNRSIKDRHIILVEDIVDTGTTLSKFIPVLKKEEPASIAIATFCHKPTALKHPLDIQYLGFEIPDKFVIGYGLDYNQRGRELEALYQLVE